MLIRLKPSRDDRDALVFEDLASALDAGLSPAQIGADPAAGDRILAAHVRRQGAEISAAEDAVLVAAWQSGRGPIAMRRLAEQRRLRADFSRTVLQRLRYPLLLISLATLVAIINSRAMGITWLPTGIGITLALGVALVLAARRGIQRGDRGWLELPLLGPCIKDLAEIPYLESLHSLYASGLPLLQAHPRAVTACPIAAMRTRLLATDALLQQGRPLAEAMLATSPVHQETVQLVANGERSGNLEEALARALTRRRNVASRTTGALARTIGNAVYFVGVTVAVLSIWSFYSSYYGMLRHH